MRTIAVLVLALLTAGCALTTRSATLGAAAFHAIEVTNQYRTPIDIHARLGTTVIPRRLARVLPGQTARVRIPAAYLRASELSLEVCRLDRILGQPNCVSTDRYQGTGSMPVLIVRPFERLTADLYGD